MTGVEFKEIRKNRLGLTQNQLAVLLGLSTKSIIRAENSPDAEIHRRTALAMLAIQVIQGKPRDQ